MNVMFILRSIQKIPDAYADILRSEKVQNTYGPYHVR